MENDTVDNQYDIYNSEMMYMGENKHNEILKN